MPIFRSRGPVGSWRLKLHHVVVLFSLVYTCNISTQLGLCRKLRPHQVPGWVPQPRSPAQALCGGGIPWEMPIFRSRGLVGSWRLRLHQLVVIFSLIYSCNISAQLGLCQKLRPHQVPGWVQQPHSPARAPCVWGVPWNRPIFRSRGLVGSWRLKLHQVVGLFSLVYTCNISTQLGLCRKLRPHQVPGWVMQPHSPARALCGGGTLINADFQFPGPCWELEAETAPSCRTI
jgi:hypothetical protein